MKNKIVLTLLGLVIVSGVFSGYIYNRYKKAKKEVVRLCDNQRSLLSEMDLYRTKDSLSAASVERLQCKHSINSPFHSKNVILLL